MIVTHFSCKLFPQFVLNSQLLEIVYNSINVFIIPQCMQSPCTIYVFGGTDFPSLFIEPHHPALPIHSIHWPRRVPGPFESLMVVLASNTAGLITSHGGSSGLAPEVREALHLCYGIILECRQQYQRVINKVFIHNALNYLFAASSAFARKAHKKLM